MAIKEDHKWKKIVIEIATKAIRKIHTDYQIVNQGQNGLNDEKLKAINTGPGFEIALEENVRDEIVNQLLAMGLWKKMNINNEERQYWIDREWNLKVPHKTGIKINAQHPHYSEKRIKEIEKAIEKKEQAGEVYNSNFNLNVDMMVVRKEKGEDFCPALIELKRLSAKTYNLPDNDSPIREVHDFEHQIEEINKDIIKLRFIRDYIKNETGDIIVNNAVTTIKDNNVVITVLVWGILPSVDYNIVNSDELDIKGLSKKEEEFSFTRYFPIDWDSTNPNKPIKRWCMVSLIEIDPESLRDN